MAPPTHAAARPDVCSIGRRQVVVLCHGTHEVAVSWSDRQDTPPSQRVVAM